MVTKKESKNGNKTSKRYYENDKERLQEQAQNCWRNLLEGEKGMKREYWRNRFKNLSKKDKQKLKEYGKSYHNSIKISYEKNLLLSIV